MKIFVCIAFMLLSAMSVDAQGIRSVATDTVVNKQWQRKILPISTFPDRNTQLIPQNFYAKNLGFFCREELKMQQAHIPVSFRVGSMDECNRLEQKPGYR